MSVMLKVVRPAGVNYHGKKHSFMAVFECEDSMAKKLVEKAKWCEYDDGKPPTHLTGGAQPASPKQVAEDQLTLEAADRVARAEKSAQAGQEAREKAAKSAKKKKSLTGAQSAALVRDEARDAETRRIAEERKICEAIQAKKGERTGGTPGRRLDDTENLAQMNVSSASLQGPPPLTEQQEQLEAEARERVIKAEKQAEKEVERNQKRAESEAAKHDPNGNKAGEITGLHKNTEG